MKQHRCTTAEMTKRVQTAVKIVDNVEAYTSGGVIETNVVTTQITKTKHTD